MNKKELKQIEDKAMKFCKKLLKDHKGLDSINLNINPFKGESILFFEMQE